MRHSRAVAMVLAHCGSRRAAALLQRPRTNPQQLPPPTISWVSSKISAVSHIGNCHCLRTCLWTLLLLLLHQSLLLTPHTALGPSFSTAASVTPPA